MGTLADGKIVIETGLDSSGIEKGLSKIGSIATKGLSVAAGAITGTSTALSGMGIAAIKVGSDFEAQMSRVQAISGATGDDLEALRNQAIQLGADTTFSASAAAEGMENLAAAGFTTQEIMEAMTGLLDLAAAPGKIWRPAPILQLPHCGDLGWKQKMRPMWRMYLRKTPTGQTPLLRKPARL